MKTCFAQISDGCSCSTTANGPISPKKQRGTEATAKFSIAAPSTKRPAESTGSPDNGISRPYPANPANHNNTDNPKAESPTGNDTTSPSANSAAQTDEQNSGNDEERQPSEPTSPMSTPITALNILISAASKNAVPPKIGNASDSTQSKPHLLAENAINRQPTDSKSAPDSIDTANQAQQHRQIGTFKLRPDLSKIVENQNPKSKHETKHGPSSAALLRLANGYTSSSSNTPSDAVRLLQRLRTLLDNSTPNTSDKSALAAKQRSTKSRGSTGRSTPLSEQSAPPAAAASERANASAGLSSSPPIPSAVATRLPQEILQALQQRLPGNGRATSANTSLRLTFESSTFGAVNLQIHDANGRIGLAVQLERELTAGESESCRRELSQALRRHGHTEVEVDIHHQSADNHQNQQAKHPSHADADNIKLPGNDDPNQQSLPLKTRTPEPVAFAGTPYA